MENEWKLVLCRFHEDGNAGASIIRMGLCIVVTTQRWSGNDIHDS